jgi:DNA-binding MarR family transcriptional regulator
MAATPACTNPEPESVYDSHNDETLARATQALRALIHSAQDFRFAFANNLGISPNDAAALSHLAVGPQSPTELAEHLGLTTSGVTTLLDRLESAGLAHRTPRPGDRRSIIAALSEPGRDALDWTTQWTHDALRELGSEQLGAATELLTALADSLQRQTANYQSASPRYDSR